VEEQILLRGIKHKKNHSNIKRMLSDNYRTAKNYAEKPLKIAMSTEKCGGKFQEIYVVPEQTLPSLDLNCDPFSLITRKEMYAIKRRYRIPTSVFSKIKECYREEKSSIDLDSSSIEAKLAFQEIEDLILGRLKKEYKNSNCDSYLPWIDPEMLGVKNSHVNVVGSSASGKSYWTAAHIRANFPEAPAIIIFSPTATTDQVWKELRKDLGKRVKLVSSNNVRLPLHPNEIPTASVVVIDDPDSTGNEYRQKEYISRLQTSLLFQGRHRKITVYSIMHDTHARGSKNAIKSANIEAVLHVGFPNINRMVFTKYLRTRLHFSKKEVTAVYSFLHPDDRAVAIRTIVPIALITRHGVKLL
tara:strand:+ start:771 stop:1841 length:1071 start_codon:yes stop_codon:yes gene_type:complete